MFGFPSGGNSSYPGAVARVDSVMTVGNTLLAYENLRLKNGDLVYVGNDIFAGQTSIQDYVRVRIGAGLTTVEGEVWNSTAMTEPQVQYERLHTPSDKYLQATDWTLTNTGPVEIIDNDGSPSHPVSMKELNRRRAGDSAGIATTITVNIPESLVSADRSELNSCMLSNWWGADDTAFVVLQGTGTRIGATLTVISYTAATGNAGNILHATGIGTRVTGLGQILIRTLTDTKKCIVQSIIDADNVRVSQPRSTNGLIGDVGSIVAFATNDVIEVLDPPTIPLMPFVPGNFMFPGASRIRFSGAQFAVMDFGNSAPFFMDCLFSDGANISGGGQSCAYGVVGLSGIANFSNGTFNAFSCCIADDIGGLTSGRLNIVNAELFVQASNWDHDNAGISIKNATMQFLSAGAEFTVFNCIAGVGTMIALNDVGAFYQETGHWNGAGNACQLGNVKIGCTMRVQATDIGVTTSAAHDFTIEDGTAGLYDRASISIVNPLGGGVIDPAAARAVGDFTFTGTLITSAGGVTASFCANPGSNLAVANLATAQQFPTGRRIFREILVTKLSGTAGVDVPVTLVIAGGTSPTTQTVTVLAADAAGTVYSDSAHPITVGFPQTFDVKMTAAIDIAPGTVKIAVTLRS